MADIRRVSVASALMGGVVWLSSYGIIGALGTSKLARLIDLAVSIPMGLIVLYLPAGCFASRSWMPQFGHRRTASAKTAVPAC